MRGLSRWSVPAVIAIVCLGTVADGQGKKEPTRRQIPIVSEPSDSSSLALPKIDLPEFIITGNEVVDFKEFSKAGVDLTLSPEAEASRGGLTRDPANTELGATWKERAAFLPPAAGLNGRFSACYGSFNTPSFEGWFGTHSPRANVLLRAGFVSSDGYVPNADYRRGFSMIHGGWQIPETFPLMPGVVMDGNLGITGRSYRFYGSKTPLRERTVGTFDLGLGLASSIFDGFNQSSAVALQATSVDDSADAKERELSADFHVRGSVEEIDVRGSFGIAWNFYSAPSARNDPYVVQGQFSGRHQIAGGVELSGGVSLYAFRGSDTRTAARIYPSLGISWYAASAVRLFASLEPTIEHARLSDLMEDNPYLRSDVRIHPTDHTLRFSIGAEGDLASGIRSRLAFTYDRMNDYPLYSDPGLTGTWNIEYAGKTTFITLDGSLYADISEDDQAGLNVTVRSTRNSETNAPVPYVSRVSVSGQYSHRFPIDVTVRSSLQMLGSSPADLSNSRSVPAYAVLSMGAEYSVAYQLEILMSLENILNSEQRRFEGYPGSRRSVGIGLRYSW
jgi:hypothetical protein